MPRHEQLAARRTARKPPKPPRATKPKPPPAPTPPGFGATPEDWSAYAAALREHRRIIIPPPAPPSPAEIEAEARDAQARAERDARWDEALGWAAMALAPGMVREPLGSIGPGAAAGETLIGKPPSEWPSEFRDDDD